MSSSSQTVVTECPNNEIEIMCPDCNEELIYNYTDSRCTLCQMCMDDNSIEIDNLHQEEQDRWEEEQTYMCALYEK